MYEVLYRSENEYFYKKLFGKKYTTVFGGKYSKYKKVCIRFAVNMNNHVKKFHRERYGKDIYFVREVTKNEKFY